MYKVKVFTMGRCRERWLREALMEYEKRLHPKMDLIWHLVEEEKELKAALFKAPSFIALDPKGTLLSSPKLSQKLCRDWGLRLTFAIGGPNGLDDALLEQATFRWSLSPLTFTHQLTRLILVEQLYRALEIERGSPYHKE